MKISENAIELIKKFEGFADRPYPDQAGHMSIGFGHKILPDESFTVITRLEAEAILEDDLKGIEEALTDLIQVDVSQNEFDSLVSLTFNIGIGNFEESTLLTLLNGSHYGSAACQFTRWIYVTKNGQKLIDQGLVNRRHAEQELFLQTA